MKLSNTKKSLYGNLQTVKMRRRHRLFTAEGAKAVADLARHFDVEAIVVTGDADAGLISLAPGAVYEATDSEMKHISSFTTPSDVMGVFRIPEESPLEIDPSRLYLILDGVRDPGNLGTIIRTCHWFGIRDILASFDTVDCYNPKTVQATMGSLGAVNVHYCNLEEVVADNPDMPVYGTLLEGDNIFSTNLDPRGFVVMGNEGTGISPGMRRLLTRGLNIPPASSDHAESLNVSVATAIVLAFFVR